MADPLEDILGIESKSSFEELTLLSINDLNQFFDELSNDRKLPLKEQIRFKRKVTKLSRKTSPDRVSGGGAAANTSNSHTPLHTTDVAAGENDFKSNESIKNTHNKAEQAADAALQKNVEQLKLCLLGTEQFMDSQFSDFQIKLSKFENDYFVIKLNHYTSILSKTIESLSNFALLNLGLSNIYQKFANNLNKMKTITNQYNDLMLHPNALNLSQKQSLTTDMKTSLDINSTLWNDYQSLDTKFQNYQQSTCFYFNQIECIMSQIQSIPNFAASNGNTTNSKKNPAIAASGSSGMNANCLNPSLMSPLSRVPLGTTSNSKSPSASVTPTGPPTRFQNNSHFSNLSNLSNMPSMASMRNTPKTPTTPKKKVLPNIVNFEQNGSNYMSPTLPPLPAHNPSQSESKEPEQSVAQRKDFKKSHDFDWTQFQEPSDPINEPKTGQRGKNNNSSKNASGDSVGSKSDNKVQNSKNDGRLQIVCETEEMPDSPSLLFINKLQEQKIAKMKQKLFPFYAMKHDKSNFELYNGKVTPSFRFQMMFCFKIDQCFLPKSKTKNLGQIDCLQFNVPINTNVFDATATKMNQCMLDSGCFYTHHNATILREHLHCSNFNFNNTETAESTEYKREQLLKSNHSKNVTKVDYKFVRHVRRPPLNTINRTWNYLNKMCSKYPYCQNGCKCKECHSELEYNYHPLQYKTQECPQFRDLGLCKRGLVCWDYHSEQDRRYVNDTEINLNVMQFVKSSTAFAIEIPLQYKYWMQLLLQFDARRNPHANTLSPPDVKSRPQLQINENSSPESDEMHAVHAGKDGTGSRSAKTRMQRGGKISHARKRILKRKRKAEFVPVFDVYNSDFVSVINCVPGFDTGFRQRLVFNDARHQPHVVMSRRGYGEGADTRKWKILVHKNGGRDAFECEQSSGCHKHHSQFEFGIVSLPSSMGELDTQAVLDAVKQYEKPLDFFGDKLQKEFKFGVTYFCSFASDTKQIHFGTMGHSNEKNNISMMNLNAKYSKITKKKSFSDISGIGNEMIYIGDGDTITMELNRCKNTLKFYQNDHVLIGKGRTQGCFDDGIVRLKSGLIYYPTVCQIGCSCKGKKKGFVLDYV